MKPDAIYSLLRNSSKVKGRIACYQKVFYVSLRSDGDRIFVWG